MMSKTHAIFGFLLGLLFLPIFSPNNQILFIFIVIMASLFPDIDHPDSKLGKYVKPIGFLFEHRGFWHSIFPLLLISLLVYFTWQPIYAFAILIGYFSHLIFDSITYQGIMFFHPFSKFKIKGFIKTGNLLEYIFFIIILFLAFYKLIHL